MNAHGFVSRARVTAWLGFGAFALVAWGPVAAWLALPFGHPMTDAWQLAVPDGRRLQVLGETVLYAAGVAVAASAVGSTAAMYCWRRSTLLARFTDAIAVLALPFPPYLHALAWLPLLAAFPGRGIGWWSVARQDDIG